MDFPENSASVLFKLLNRNNILEVGFRTFMVDYPKSDDEMKNLVEDEKVIALKWPQCKISEAATMRERLKNTEWDFLVAKVIAYGGKSLLYVYFFKVQNLNIIIGEILPFILFLRKIWIKQKIFNFEFTCFYNLEIF